MYILNNPVSVWRKGKARSSWEPYKKYISILNMWSKKTNTQSLKCKKKKKLKRKQMSLFSSLDPNWESCLSVIPLDLPSLVNIPSLVNFYPLSNKQIELTVISMFWWNYMDFCEYHIYPLDLRKCILLMLQRLSLR